LIYLVKFKERRSIKKKLAEKAIAKKGLKKINGAIAILQPFIPQGYLVL